MNQLQIIDQVRKIGIEDDKISAILMYGSFTKGEGDQFSDVEFYVFLRKDCIIDKRGLLSSVLPVDMLFTNEFGTDVVIFENLIRGEFHFHPVSEITTIRTWQGMLNFEVRDKMNLVDKDGLLTEVLNSIENLRPEWNTPENIIWVADSMINHIIFVNNVIQRGEYVRAEHLFFFLQKYMALLIRLHLNTTGHWLDPMKGFEKEIPAEWHKKYTNCIPGPGVNSLKKCLWNTILLTQELFSLLHVSEHDVLILNKIITKLQKVN